MFFLTPCLTRRATITKWREAADSPPIAPGRWHRASNFRQAIIQTVQNSGVLALEAIAYAASHSYTQRLQKDVCGGLAQVGIQPANKAPSTEAIGAKALPGEEQLQYE